jgi:Transglutaminase-like superfamily
VAYIRWFVTRFPLGVEAAVTLTLASLRLAVVPDRGTARLLGRLDTVPPPDHESEIDPAAAMRIGRAVDQLAGVLPWHPVCLPRTIAVTAMLRRRRITCRAHLGIVTANKTAHAWVTVGRTVVQGAPLDGVTEVASFG